MVEPHAGVHPLVRAIDKAQNQIFLEMYILSDSRVIRALQRAEVQGVEVYVLLERHPFGLPIQPISVAERLRASGVHVRWSRPGFTYTHAKFAVLDDRLAIISTANFSRSAFSHNREFLVSTRRKVDVRALSSIFRADWDRLPIRITDTNLIISPENARTKLRCFLGAARHSVDIYAEEVADVAIEKELIRLAKRGIRVRLLLPPGPSPAVAPLRLGGIEVRQLRVPYVHAKMMVIDGREAFVGSENLSTTSMNDNREVGIFLRSGSIAVLERTFERDWTSHE